MYNTLFIKYFYLFLLFCVVFGAMYNSVTEAVGFKFLTGIQSLYLVIFVFQLLNDGSKDMKSLRITIPKTKYTYESSLDIPLYWVIVPSLIIQLVSSVFVTLTSDYLQKKYNMVKLSRNNRYKLNMFKWMFIVTTISLMGLTYCYCNDFVGTNIFSQFSGSYKSWLLLLFFSTIIFSISNYVISQKLSKIMVSSTD